MDPITITIFGIACVALGGVGATVAPKCWEAIVISLKGKKIAVLGERRVGKTTLLKYMTEGILIDEYTATLASKETKKRLFKLDDLDIKVRKTRDVSGAGNQNVYNAWKNLFKDSDLVFYLVRADKLIERDADTQERVIADMTSIEQWIKNKDIYKQQRIFIIGNHWEPHPVFSKLGDCDQGKFLDDFVELPSVKHMMSLASDAHVVKVVIGSLANKKSADKLITQIFHEVVNDGR